MNKVIKSVKDEFEGANGGDWVAYIGFGVIIPLVAAVSIYIGLKNAEIQHPSKDLGSFSEQAPSSLRP